jgi:demethylmenaquinone methyltransferase / 2-methoxy-6-polyprenyl-1,4-benzoquinol methylase
MNPHTQLVRKVFKSVASKYDIMNDLMSAGLHRKWKRTFVNLTFFKANHTYLDLAAGTGDISRIINKEINTLNLNGKIIAMDPSTEMMEKGQAKLINDCILKGVEWMIGSAESIPLPDSSINTVLISFGLRNVTDHQLALSEIYRVLKPGGQFLCLEFSHVENLLLNSAYSLYSRHVIPLMGKIVANDKASYEYLTESIRKFPDQEKLKNMIQNSGFCSASYRNLSKGIVAIHEGWKPND